jgi:hypothetical protein
MGMEAECTVRCGRKKTTGVAHLETEEVTFRGEWKLRIPFKEITNIDVQSGDLHLTYSDGTAVFALGPQAEKWAAKIRTPKSLIDKLGVKPESRVIVQSVDDDDFMKQLKARTPHLGIKPCDIFFLGVTAKNDLMQLKDPQKTIVPNGAIWVVWKKGQAHLKESDVMAAGKAAGLVDVKVAKFSESHSALKLVIPLARR